MQEYESCWKCGGTGSSLWMFPHSRPTCCHGCKGKGVVPNESKKEEQVTYGSGSLSVTIIKSVFVPYWERG